MFLSVSMDRSDFMFKVNWSRRNGKHFLDYLTMIRKTLGSFEMSGNIYPKIRRYIRIDFDALLTVHLNIFISVINQLDALNFCFTISLFHASTCFEHMFLKYVEV